jgi:hypothetical protein
VKAVAPTRAKVAAARIERRVTDIGFLCFSLG